MAAAKMPQAVATTAREGSQLGERSTRISRATCRTIRVPICAVRSP
jgi:hypothetical protein